MIIFDLETGGLDSKVHPIIQIAAMRVDGFCRVLDTFEVKVAFDVKDCSPEALQGNHYDELTWKREAVDLRNALDFFSRFINTDQDRVNRTASGSGAKYEAVIAAGYNVHFDLGFLFDKVGEIRNAGGRCYLKLDKHALCVRQLAAWYFHLRGKEYPQSMKLTELAKFLGIDFDGDRAHDALYDVELTRRVMRKLIPKVQVR